MPNISQSPLVPRNLFLSHNFPVVPHPFHTPFSNRTPYPRVLNTFNTCSAPACFATPPPPPVLPPLRSQPAPCCPQSLHPVTNCNRRSPLCPRGRGGLSKGRVGVFWSESQGSGQCLVSCWGSVLHSSLVILSQHSSSPLPQGFCTRPSPWVSVLGYSHNLSCSDIPAQLSHHGVGWGRGWGFSFRRQTSTHPFSFSPLCRSLVHMSGRVSASGGPAQSGDSVGLSCCSVSEMTKSRRRMINLASLLHLML